MFNKIFLCLKIAFLPFLIILLIFELILFRFLNIKNSKISYQTMIKLFTLTGGISNKIINNFLKKKIKKIELNENLKKISDSYNQNGFYLFENYLSINEINEFKNQLSLSKGYWFGDKLEGKNKEKLDNKNIKDVKFYYDCNDLMKLGLVKTLIKDQEIINLAKVFLVQSQYYQVLHAGGVFQVNCLIKDQHNGGITIWILLNGLSFSFI